jgi:hypothetical protein
VIGRGVTACVRAGDELLERRRSLDDLRLQRPAPAHRDDDHVAVAREEPCELHRDGGLADALAGADHRDRRQVERRERRRVEAEVGADVRQPGGERARHPAEALGRAEHGLVAQVDHHLRVTEAVDEWHAVVAAGRSFSVPPTRIAPTHSYAKPASASRTTGA